MRNLTWYKNSDLLNNLFINNDLFLLNFYLKYFLFIWDNKKLITTNLLKSTPSYSMVNTPGRSNWQPINI
jgi:hypothetical protein